MNCFDEFADNTYSHHNHNNISLINVSSATTTIRSIYSNYMLPLTAYENDMAPGRLILLRLAHSFLIVSRTKCGKLIIVSTFLCTRETRKIDRSIATCRINETKLMSVSNAIRHPSDSPNRHFHEFTNDHLITTENESVSISFFTLNELLRLVFIGFHCKLTVESSNSFDASNSTNALTSRKYRVELLAKNFSPTKHYFGHHLIIQ